MKSRVEVARSPRPSEERRDRRRRRAAAQSRRKRDRLPLSVLVRVDRDAPSLRLRPLTSSRAAMRALERLRHDVRELAGVGVRVAALDRDEHVHPVRAARLREATRARARRAPP